MKGLPLLHVRGPNTFVLPLCIQCPLRPRMLTGLSFQVKSVFSPIMHPAVPRWLPDQNTLEPTRALSCPPLTLSACSSLHVPGFSSVSNEFQLILLRPRDCTNKTICVICTGRWGAQRAIAKISGAKIKQEERNVFQEI